MEEKGKTSKNNGEKDDQKILVIFPGEGEVYVSEEALLKGGAVILVPPKKKKLK